MACGPARGWLRICRRIRVSPGQRLGDEMKTSVGGCRLPLKTYIDLCHGARRLDDHASARRFYVDYHALLCRVGIYSAPLLAGSLLRGATLRSPALRPGSEVLVVLDGAGANGAATLGAAGFPDAVNLSPGRLLSWLPPSRRPAVAARLLAASASPERFFGKLYDACCDIFLRYVLQPDSREIVAANERSVVCAPVLAAARFRAGLQVKVVQHGNPVADYLPTLAHTYLCRSDRWDSYLRRVEIVPNVQRIRDFPPFGGITHCPGSRQVVLVMHNIGYLEPNIDYRLLVREIDGLCRERGYSLGVFPHPSCRETFGLPVLAACGSCDAGVAIGFRTTVMDQLPDSMPKVSLLDYWPSFFLEEGGEGMLEDYLIRVRGVLS